MNSTSENTSGTDVQIVASLSEEWVESCEELLYFNPQQGLFQGRILTSVQSFGLPTIAMDDGRLVISLGPSFQPSMFFALVPAGSDIMLVGLILFTREANAMLCIHLSVAEDYSSRGLFAGLRVAHRLLDAVRKVARRVEGVEEMLIYYNRHSYSIPTCRPLVE